MKSQNTKCFHKDPQVECMPWVEDHFLDCCISYNDTPSSLSQVQLYFSLDYSLLRGRDYLYCFWFLKDLTFELRVGERLCSNKGASWQLEKASSKKT